MDMSVLKMEIHRIIFEKIKSGFKVVLGIILAFFILIYLWTNNLISMIFKK